MSNKYLVENMLNKLEEKVELDITDLVLEEDMYIMDANTCQAYRLGMLYVIKEVRKWLYGIGVEVVST